MLQKQKLKINAFFGLLVYISSAVFAPLAQALNVPLSLPLVSVVSVAVTPANGTLLVGHTQQYTATATYSDNTTADVTNDPATTWSVVDPGIATTDSTGLVTAVTEGNTSVVAQYLGVNGNTPLTVTNVFLVSVTVAPVDQTYYQNRVQQYNATANFSDGSTLDVTHDPATAWSIGDTSLALISNTGLFTANTRLGSSTVNAQYQTVTGSTNFTIIPALSAPSGFSGPGASSGSYSGTPSSLAPEPTSTPTPAPEATPPASPSSPTPTPEAALPTPPIPESTSGPTPTPEGQIPPPLPSITVPPFSPDTIPATVTLVSKPSPQPISYTLQTFLAQQILPPADGVSRGQILENILKQFTIEKNKYNLLKSCTDHIEDCLSIFASYSSFTGLNLHNLSVDANRGLFADVFTSLTHAQEFLVTPSQIDVPAAAIQDQPQQGVRRQIIIPAVLGVQTRIDTSHFQLYPDVPLGAPYIDAINKATMLNIVNGYYEEPGSPFKPDRIVTRIEALKILLNATDLMKWKYYSEMEALLGGPDGIKNQKVPFNDVFPDRDYMWWYPRYINKACDVGLIDCKPGTSFNPDAYMTNDDFNAWETNLHDYFKKNNVAAIENADPDKDTLPTYIEENVYLTDPQQKDTDNDGLPDNEEVQKYHTSPFLTDTDGDGLSDYDEVTKYHTDPLKIDTDGDGVSDSEEVRAGTDPLGPKSFPTDKNAVTGISQTWERKYGIVVQNGSQDTDGDGLSDALEYQYGTDPTKADTDDDGYTDGEEVLSLHTNPLDPNDPGKIEKLGVRITNFIEGQLVADPEPLIKGVAPTNAIVEIVLRNAYGAEKILGQAVADQNNIFIFQVPSAIRDGKYILVARALLPQQQQVLESSPVNVVIDSTLDVQPPAPKKLSDQQITQDVLLKDVRVEIHDQKPVLVGKTSLGDKVNATWRSIVVSSALIADTTTGDFSIAAPNDLGYGKHEVYVQAVRQQDGAMSKNLRISFTISPTFSTAGLKSSAPEQKSNAGFFAAVGSFATRQSMLFWMIFGLVGFLLAAAGVYYFKSPNTKKKKK